MHQEKREQDVEEKEGEVRNKMCSKRDQRKSFVRVIEIHSGFFFTLIHTQYCNLLKCENEMKNI